MASPQTLHDVAYQPLDSKDVEAGSPDATNVTRSAQSVLGRHKDRRLTLPATSARTIIVDAQAQEPSQEGRIGMYCTAEAYDMVTMQHILESRHAHWFVQHFTGAVYGRYETSHCEPKGHIFYFHTGVTIFWGLTKQEEQEVLQNVVSGAAVVPLEKSEVQEDALRFVYSDTATPSIENDTITLDGRTAVAIMVKLSISFALAYSTKLMVTQGRVQTLVEATHTLPLELAKRGDVHTSDKEVTQLMGCAFIQKANLRCNVPYDGNVPEFFWTTGEDSLQQLYSTVVDYLEIMPRVSVLINRIDVMQNMLSILRDHEVAKHGTYLEWIVILLIAAGAFFGLLQAANLLGLIGRPHA